MQVTELKDNSIIILPNQLKQEVIKQVREELPLLNIKFMSLQELIHQYCFGYDNKTIHYLMKKYHYKYEVAVMYLEHLYYIENKTYEEPKLDFLVTLKKELEKEHLLIHNSLFKKSIKNKHIIIIGYDLINHFQYQILSEITPNFTKEITKTEYIHDTIYELNTLEEEVEFVAGEICKLIKQGISPNHIKLMGITSDYYNSINRIFSFYHLPIHLDNNISIYSTAMGQYFLNHLEEDIQTTLKEIKSHFPLHNPQHNEVYNEIINILNTYTSWITDYREVIELLKYDFKKHTVSLPQYEEEIQVISLHNSEISEEDYVFLMGFNAKNIPHIYKDEDYFNDTLKQILNLETTSILNMQEKEQVKNKIKSIKNLTITYKQNSNDSTFIISNLNEDLQYQVVTVKNKNYQYSHLANQLHLASSLDNLIKYNTKDSDLPMLYHNYKNIPYQTYNNNFTGINTKNLKEYLHQELLLSYSSLDNYYRCGFKYYIANILKLSIYDDTFMTTIGNIFHYILSQAFQDNFNFEKEYQTYIESLDKDFNPKEQFFLKKLKPELQFVIDTIHKQYTYSSLDQAIYEEKITIEYPHSDMKITFMGIIDKVMYQENANKTYIAIIDYKTGNPNINLNSSVYGISMQLPIYIYLSKNNNKLQNVEVVGFYLQHILNNEIVKDYKHNYLNLKEDNLKLQGYSNTNETMLALLDNHYQDSNVIKSMKLSSKGFYSYAKVLNNDQMNKLSSLVEDKIKEATTKIIEGDFSINPKRIGIKNVGCEFCKFKDICYMTEDNIVNLKEYKQLEFLTESNQTT